MGAVRELVGPVLFDYGGYPFIDFAQGYTGISTGHAQVGCPLDVFPIRFELISVAKLVEQSIQGLLVKHGCFYRILSLVYWSFTKPVVNHGSLPSAETRSHAVSIKLSANAAPLYRALVYS